MSVVGEMLLINDESSSVSSAANVSAVVSSGASVCQASSSSVANVSSTSR